MSELERPIGIGFASRGEVAEVVSWVEQARHRQDRPGNCATTRRYRHAFCRGAGACRLNRH